MLEIVNRSAEHLAERAAVFREADLCTLALAHSPGLHTHADYAAALNDIKRDGHLVDDLPPDLAAMAGDRPGLEARDREVRKGVREVAGFEARRRKIINRAAWLRPERPLGKSVAGSYGRWTRSASKVIGKGERLASDPLLAPDDHRTLERALTRNRAAPDADGLDAQRLRP